MKKPPVAPTRSPSLNLHQDPLPTPLTLSIHTYIYTEKGNQALKATREVVGAAETVSINNQRL